MAGTTCSSGLNNLLSGSKVTQTTLPNWYSTAQQNLINMAGAGAANAPTNIAGTTVQNAVSNLNNPNNAFSTATGALGTIAKGAANPFSVCASTGQVNPNVGTPLGSLFAAQRQQLCQLLPQTIAPVVGNSISSGNFGSLRCQVATNTAKTNAFDTLAAQQLTAALNNQQTGAAAGTALGNVGAACVAANLNTGTAQFNAPFSAASNYGNIVNAINAPKTCMTQCQLSPLTAIQTLAGTPAVLCAAVNSITGKGPGTLGGALKSLYCNIFGGTCATSQSLGLTGNINNYGGTGISLDQAYANATPGAANNTNLTSGTSGLGD